MKGTIISITPVLDMLGGKLSTTVIYEREGQRYRGVQFTRHEDDGDVLTYYFGGGGASTPYQADIDVALEMAYRLT